MQAVSAKKELILQSWASQISHSGLFAGFEVRIEGRFNGSADKDTDHKLIYRCYLLYGCMHIEFSWKKKKLPSSQRGQHCILVSLPLSQEFRKFSACQDLRVTEEW